MIMIFIAITQLIICNLSVVNIIAYLRRYCSVVYVAIETRPQSIDSACVYG